MSLENPKIPTQEAWQAPTLVNSWINYGGNFNPVGYWKDSFGLVHLRGVVKNGTPESVIFTLPSGYRPSSYEGFTSNGANTMGYQVVRIDIQTDGSVVAKYFLGGAGAAVFLFLDGFTFRAA